MRGRRVVVPISLAAGVLFVACTSAPPPLPKPGSWIKAGAGLPSGDRFIVQDRSRDSLWVLTMNPDFDTRAGTLAEVSWTGRVRSRVPLGNIPGYIPDVGAAIALDSEDNVWMVWGTTLTKYSPTKRRLKTYPVPIAQTAPKIRRDLLGITSGLAITGETVWTAVDGVRVLQRFDIRTETWEAEVPIPTKPARLFGPIADGKIIVTGSALLVVDPVTGHTTRHDVELFDVLATPSDKLIYDTNPVSQSSMKVFDPATGAEAVLLPGVHVSRASSFDERNRLWTIRVEPRAIHIERVDLETKNRASFLFPGRRLGSDAWRFCRIGCQSPDPDAIYPTNIVAVAASKDRVLVFTTYGGDRRSIYPPIYRLVL